MNNYLKSSECAAALGLSLKYFQNQFVFSSGMDTWAKKQPGTSNRRMWDKKQFEIWMSNRVKNK